MKHILTLLSFSVLWIFPTTEILAQSACTCPEGRVPGQSPFINLPGNQPVRVNCFEDLLGALSDQNGPYFMSSFDAQDNGMAPLCILTPAPLNSCLDTIQVQVDAQDSDGYCAQNGPVTITVILKDTVPPMITLCPEAAEVACTESLDPEINTPLGIPDYEDLCAGDVTVSYVDVTVASNCASDYELARTWIVGDACGNTTTCVQTITVTDNAPPTFNAPPDYVTVAVDGTCMFNDDVSVTGEPTDLADCDPIPNIELDELPSFSSCGLPQVTRTWTISDGCGNSTAFMQTVEMVDLIAPMIQDCPENTTVECDDVLEILPLEALDNCSGILVASGTETTSEDPDFPGFCDDYYLLTRTWVAEDNCGNTSSCTQEIIVRDMTDPMIECPEDVVVSCEQGTDPAVTGEPDVSDNCTDPIDPMFVVPTDVTISSTCPQSPVIHRTWTVQDDCQNSATCLQVITVQDLTEPQITCPADKAVSCEDEKTPTELGVAVAGDNCDGAPEVSHSDMNTPGSCLGNYTITRTWTAEDACGNSSSCDQLITVTDSDAPVFSVTPMDTVMQCGDDPMTRLMAWEAHFGGATAMDNCGILTWSSEIAGPTDECGETGVYTMTVTVKDDCLNESQETATFTLEDTMSPAISCMQSSLNATHTCDGPAGNAAAAEAWNEANKTALLACSTDACSDADLVVDSDFDLSNFIAACGNTGTLTVTYSVTDNCNNTSTITGVFTIVDNTAPSLSACGAEPEGATVECAGAAANEEAAELWNAANISALEACAEDGCNDVTVTSNYNYGNLSNGCGETGTLTVTYTVSDGCNSTSAMATFTVTDMTPPSLMACMADLNETVECAGAIANEAAANAWNAANITTLQGCATDACGGVTVTSNYNFNNLSNGCGLTGILIVTYTATDDCGLTATTTATFTVEDTEAPAFTALPQNYPFACQNGDPQLELDIWEFLRGGATASDACSPVTWGTQISGPTDECGRTATYTMTVTIEDECGNADFTTAEFNILDEEPPVLSGCDPDDLDLTYECSGVGNEAAAISWNQANEDRLATCATDVCSDEPLIVTSNFNFTNLVPGTCGGEASLTVTYSVTDNCGNTSTITGTFTIEDNIAPSFAGCGADPVNGSVECAGAAANEAAANDWNTANIAALEACATDACSNVTVSSDYDFSDLSNGCGNTGTLTVTYTVSDGCNSSTTSAMFTVLDMTPPSLMACMADLNETVECAGPTANEAAANAWNAANINTLQVCATDACGGVTVTSNYNFNNLSNGCGLTGILIVTYTATDDCGLTAATTATFTVEDTEAPTFTALPQNYPFACQNGDPQIELSVWELLRGGATAIDGCSPVMWGTEISVLEDECGRTGTYTMTVTISDECGNSDFTTAEFNILDEEPPVLTGCDPDNLDLTYECSGLGNEAAALSWNLANMDLLALCATDICSDLLPLDVTSNFAWTNFVPGTCGGEGTLTVTYSVTDNCGNTSMITGTFTIEDNDAPDLSGCTASLDETVECAGALANETAADNWNAANIAALELCAADACSDVTVSSDYDFNDLSNGCGTTGTLTVTYTVSDGCNSTSTMATFTVEDTEEPSLMGCVADLNETVECAGASGNELAADGWNAANIAILEGCAEDACGSVTVTSNYDYDGLSDGCGETGSLTVTYTVTDECGNSTSTSATFTVVDTEGPEFTAGPNDETVECGPNVAIELSQWLSSNAGALATDMCSGVTIANVGFVSTPGCGKTQVVTMTVRATDACGNQTSEPVTFTVEDNAPPVIGCNDDALDFVQECVGTGNESAAEAWDAGNITLLEGCSTDECADEPLAVTSDFDWANVVYAGCGGEGSLTVTYSVTDNCGNTSTIAGTFTIEDNEAPDLSSCTTSFDGTAECAGSSENESAADDWNAANIAALEQCAADACSDVTVSSDYDFNDLSNDCGNTGMLMVTYTVSDGCNSTTTSATFTITDITLPSLMACPADLNETVECAGAAANETAADAWNATNMTALQGCAADACGSVTVTSNYDYNDLSNGCGETGTLTVTYTVTDECGNSTSTTATLTVVDTEAPEFAAGPNDQTVECGPGAALQLSQWLSTNAGAQAADDCSAVTISNVGFASVPGCGETQVISMTVRATDACGNQTNEPVTFTVEDNTPPVIACNDDALDFVQECVGTGNESAAETWDAGNITLLEGCSTDDCSDEPLAVTSDFDWANVVYAGCGGEGSLTVTYSVTDNCGITSTITGTFTIEDNVAPSLAGCGADPVDSSVECAGVAMNEAAAEDWNAANITTLELCASDACSDVTVSSDYDFSVLSNGCGSTGTLTVTYTVTDGCNSTSAMATFSVVDNTPPTLASCTNDLNETLECAGAMANEAAADTWNASNIAYLEGCAADACGAVSVSSDYDFDDLSDGCGETGALTVTYTVTDACGLTTSTSATITIMDSEDPAWSQPMPSDVTVQCHAVPAVPTSILGMDDCSGSVTVNLTISTINGNCDDNYVLTRTWTATDACGNMITHTQEITVIDTQAPSWSQSMPSDVTVACHAVPAPAAPITATDLCDLSVSVTYDQQRTDGNCPDTYTLTRTWTAEDNCGNKATHTQTIAVQDVQAPTWNQAMPSDVTVECHAVPMVPSGLTAADLCDTDVTVSFSESVASGNCPDNYTLTRTWTAEDNCGNQTTYTQTITVRDTQAPSWSQAMPANTTVECSAIPAPASPILATDLCDSDVSVSFTEVRTDGACPDNYTLTRTWIAVDDCGNSTSHAQVLTVRDTQAPVWEQTMPANVTVECSNLPQPPTNLTATDLCDLSVTVTYGQNITPGNCTDNYTITRTWTATDNCGNAITHTQVITVRDTQLPTWDQAMPANVTVECHAVPFVPSIAASDNCDGNVTVTYGQIQTAGTCPDAYTLTRTWTAQDNCGNQTTHTQVITVRDTQAPIWGQQMPADVTVECNAVPSVPSPITATDLCDVSVSVTYGQVRTDGNCPDTYLLTRTWTAEDNCGNKTTHTQVITVLDTQAPIWNQSMPVNVTVECNAVPNPPSPITASDLCDVSVSVSYTQVRTDGNCPDSYSLARTWIATDNCGNAITHTQVITVRDTQAPVWSQSMPVNVTVECNAVPNPPSPILATDLCDVSVSVTYTQVRTDGNCPDTYTLTRTWTAEDNCSNKTTHTQVITVRDTQAPIWSQSMPVNVTVECNAVPAVPSPINATDNCDISTSVTYVQVRTDGNCTDTYTLTRTWTAEDNCANKTTHTQTITVRDTQAPTWSQSMPANTTVECSAVPAVPSSINASDNCDASVSVTFVEVQTAGNCPDNYTLTRTWTAEDNCSNKTTHTQVITVRDTQAPTWSQAMPANVTVECSNVPLPPASISATDLCDVSVAISFGQNITPGSCPDSYTITRTWTANDNCGNAITHTQVITVRDTQAPGWDQTMPSNITVECNAVPAPLSPVTATDNCDAAVNVSYNQVQTSGSCPDRYTLTRTWTAEDNCGNKTTHTQTITVQDTQAPTWNQPMPGNVTVECNAVPVPPFPVSANDNCDLGVSVTYGQTQAAGNCADRYTLTRTWTAEDNCGNKTTHVQTITVQDTQAPSWSQQMPASITVECNSVPPPASPIAASDNCDVSVSISYNQLRTDGNCPDTYTLTRTWIATDNCGNAITHVQTITVQDTQVPNWSQQMPANITVECNAVPAPASPINATDNCDLSVSVTYAQVRTDGNCPDTYTLTRTWVATDNCGNAITHVQAITVRDTQVPTWSQSMPPNVTVECNAVPAVPAIAASDNCDMSVDISYTQVRTDGNCPDTYTLVRTWIATDNCGNAITHTQTLTVRDTQMPIWNQAMPANVTVECSAVPAPAAPINATDNCDASVEVNFSEVRTDGNCPDTYTLTRTWIANDNCGNNTTHTQILTVRDTQLPMWSQTMPANVTVECSAVPAVPTIASSDNCDLSVEVTFHEVRTNGSCEDTYVLTRTWIATDNCGNAITHTQVITVRDTQAPLVTCKPFTAYLNINGVVTIQPQDVVAVVTDNCDLSVSLALSKTTFNCGNVGPNTVTLTATDNCANASQCNALVTVLDTVPPTALCQNVTIFLDNNGQASTNAAAVNNGSNDACGIASVVLSRTQFFCSDLGDVAVTLTVTDVNGNVATCGAFVQVRDIIPPTVQCKDATINLNAQGQATLFAYQVESGSSDNCQVFPQSVVPSQFTCAQVGFNSVTYTVSDAAGNTASCQSTVLVRDLIPPTLSCKDITVEIGAQGNPVSVSVNDLISIATDNCGLASLTSAKTSFSCADAGANQVFVEATDPSGNKNSCIALVTVRDNIPPYWTYQPGDTTVYCSEKSASDFPLAADNCGNVQIVLVSETQELWPGGPKDGYRVRRIWSATDPSYNVIQYTQLVYVIVDGDFLTFCNPDIITQVTNIPIRVDWTAPYIDDVCVGKVDMVQIGGPAPNSFLNPGSRHIITYEYVDSYGIRYQCSFWVTIPAATSGYLLTFNEQDCPERQLTSCQVKDLPAPDNSSLEWIQPGMNPVILDLDLSGSFETFADGTARLQGGWSDVPNACGWDVDIRLHRRRTYNGWTAAGGLVSNALGVSNPQSWNFFEVDGSGSTVTGTGCNAGKKYAVTISPNFPKFGFQLGNGANQKTTPNGGWMVVGIRDLADGSLVAQGIFSFELTCQNTNRIKDAATVISQDGFTYPVNWSNGKTGYLLGDVGPGTYSVTITDKAGMDSVITFPVSLPTGCNLYYENECRPISVAVDGKAKQSGTLGGADAARAIDDNTDGNLANGSVSQTPNSGRNWWTLDLIKPADVAFLRLWNRTDCCGDVLDPFWVFVSEYPIPNDADPDSVALLPGVTTFFHEGPVDTFVDLAYSGLARYVKVQLDQFGSLALAEVQVLVCQPDEVGIDTDAFTGGGEENSALAAKEPMVDQVPQVTPWPNPVDDLLQLTVEQDEAHPVTVSVMNILGTELYRVQLPAGKLHQLKVDTGSWAPGTYYVTVTAPFGASSRQVTVQR